MSLSPQQLGQLIPLAPTLMAWLRQVDRKAGDLFLQDSSADLVEVTQTLRELLNALNYNGDLTMVQVRYICEAHDPTVWASAVRYILTSSEPKLVSEKIGSALVGSLPKLDGAKNASDCCKILGPLLDMLPRTHYQGKRVPQKQTAAAAAVMDLMIEECEPIFGRPAARTRGDAFGIRPTARTNNRREKPSVPARPAPPPGLGMERGLTRGNGSSAAKPDSRMARRKQQLRAFYQWRDPSRAEKVDALLENHAFQDVAKAIHRKYGMLPPGWRVDLEELQKELGMKFDWLEKATREANRQQNKNTFVTPAVPAIKHEPAPKTSNKMDKVIDEIADTEQVYHDKLSDMIEGFVKELRVISSGQRGKAAADGLGLTLAQVEQIFGWRLDEIVGVSNNLLSKLEVVTLVRTEPKTGTGRLGLVAKAFAEIATDLHVYSPYVTSHASSAVQLEKSRQAMEANESGRGRGRFGGRGNQQAVDNWMKLWEKFSSQSENLKGRTVADLLIEPVQRFMRYKLLLKTLKKEVPVGHKELPELERAFEVVSEAVDQIHEALKQHERVAKKLGLDADAMPLPGNLRNGKAGIKNDWRGA